MPKIDAEFAALNSKIRRQLSHDNNNQPEGRETGQGFVNPARWQGVPVPEREWFIEGLIPHRQVTLLSGDGGVGKSLLALQIAAAGAMNVETLGWAPRDGKTLYIGAEDEIEEFQRRLGEITAEHGRDFCDTGNMRLKSLANEDALLSVPDKSGTMGATKLLDDIYDFADLMRPKLICLDTAADLFGGDEIKRSQVRQFISLLRQMAISLDCAIVLLSHPSVSGMQSGSGSSGSTAWNNSVRSRLYLTRPDGRDEDPDMRILKVMKANYGKTGADIRMRWKNGAFVLDDGKPSKKSAFAMAHAERVFVELLTVLDDQGQQLSHKPSPSYAPKVMASNPDCEGLSKSDLAAAMQRLLNARAIVIEEYGPASKRRSRLKLA